MHRTDGEVVCAEDHLPMAAPLGVQADLTARESASPRRRSFPGEPRQVSEMRNWLKSFLPEFPAREDVLYVASELATNAIKHTRTGQGGWFNVEIVVRGGEGIRMAITDAGGLTTPRIVDEPDCEHGRGLRLVRALSASDGYSGDESGCLVWAEIPWKGISEGRA